MKKKDKTNMYWILGVVFIVVLIIGGNAGWFKGLNITNLLQAVTPLPDKIQPNNLGYVSNLRFSPTTLCIGQSSFGSLDTNIPNGICTVFTKTNNGAWIMLNNINLDGNGDYSSTSPPFNSAETISFVTTCCDGNGNCKISNEVTITVNNCNTDTDGDGIPDSTDTDDDNDGFSDAEEIQQGTDPLDPNDFPQTTNCDSICTNLGYLGGRQVSSYSECNLGTEVPTTDNYGTNCCCTQSSTPEPPPEPPPNLLLCNGVPVQEAVCSERQDACASGYRCSADYFSNSICSCKYDSLFLSPNACQINMQIPGAVVYNIPNTWSFGFGREITNIEIDFGNNQFSRPWVDGRNNPYTDTFIAYPVIGTYTMRLKCYKNGVLMSQTSKQITVQTSY